MFWTFRGLFWWKHLKRESFNSKIAVKMLGKLEEAIRASGRQVGLDGAFLHWDNARPHFSKITKAAVKTLRLGIVPHPPYSPDLAPCDFFFLAISRKS
jgi:histone-lysine N-methyltransferase SETMAR